MDKIALVFPGQASQYVGMGRELYDKYPSAKQTLDAADGVLGYDLKKIIFEGPLEILTQTRYTQPAVFTVSVACFRVFASQFQLPASGCFCAGHSLGEYSALVAAGVLSFEDALKLVSKRAELLQQACDKTRGTMLAILGAEKSAVEELCAAASSVGVCEPVNFNAPGQIVISGEAAAIEKARALAKEKKIKAIPLAVSGAFHSSLMKEAAAGLAEEMKKYVFKNPVYPVVTNCDAKMTTDAAEIPDKLVRQVASPVLWIDSVNNIISSGCGVFVELGPKAVVSGMIKKISAEAKVFNVENEATLTQTVGALSAV